MTPQHLIISPERHARNQAVYDEARDLGWDGTLPLPQGMAFAIVKSTGLSWFSVTKPLRDGRRNAPEPDPVALERAWAWDWGVIDNLSDVEWTIFVNRLATDPDPWGEAESFVTKATLRFFPREEYERSYTARYSAYLSRPEDKREAVKRAVIRQRKRLGLIGDDNAR